MLFPERKCSFNTYRPRLHKYARPVHIYACICPEIPNTVSTIVSSRLISGFIFSILTIMYIYYVRVVTSTYASHYVYMHNTSSHFSDCIAPLCTWEQYLQSMAKTIYYTIIIP